MRKKTITLFLMDGKVTGRIKCSLANWTGVSYKIPRTELSKCSDISALSQSGIYFLFGSNEDNEDIVYIGQAGMRKNNRGILERLSEHHKNPKFDWIESVIFTTTNNSFGPTDISYLEHSFYNIAKNVNRATICNANEPTLGNVTEEKESELEEFIHYAKIIIGTLGYTVLEPLTENNEIPTNQKENEELQLFLERTIKETNIKVKGIAKRTSEGIVVLKGSELNPDNSSPNISDSLKKIRESHITNGNKLQKDILFNSPSQAARFVIGNSSNGRSDWKTKDGLSLKEFEEKEANSI